MPRPLSKTKILHQRIIMNQNLEITKSQDCSRWLLSDLFSGRRASNPEIKMNFFVWVSSSFPSFGKHLCPFKLLLLFSHAFLTLPAKIPEVKIDIKTVSNKPSKGINMKTNYFFCHRNSEMPITQKQHMKTSRYTAKTRCKGKGDWFFSEREGVASKNDKKPIQPWEKSKLEANWARRSMRKEREWEASTWQIMRTEHRQLREESHQRSAQGERASDAKELSL